MSPRKVAFTIALALALTAAMAYGYCWGKEAARHEKIQEDLREYQGA
jgi:hypothetical protein